MNITVCGGGNGANALAGYLGLHGHSVRLYETPEFAKNVEYLSKNNQTITMVGDICGKAHIDTVTTDALEAVSGAQVIFVIVPSFGQESIFEHIAPYIEKGQTIFIMPGNFGSISLHNKLVKRGIANDVILGEGDTIPFATRLTSEKHCNIFGVKPCFWCSAIPATQTNVLRKNLEGVLPVELMPLPSVVAVAMANTNMIIHCPTMIMNAGRIENGEPFRFYCDGMSKSVCTVMERMDEERIQIAQKLGYKLVPEFEDALMNYDLDKSKYSNLHDIFSNHPVYSKMGPDSPNSVTHRYLTEDVPYLLVPLAELGALTNVVTPTIDAVIQLAGVVNRKDFKKDGRGIAKLGFANMTLEQIKMTIHG